MKTGRIPWYKHDNDAHRDVRLMKLIRKHGMAAYGLYWFMLELITSEIHDENVTYELSHDAPLLAYMTGLPEETVDVMVRFMIELDLFSNSGGRIQCLQLANRLATSSTRNPATRKTILATQKALADPASRNVMTCHDVSTPEVEVEVEVENISSEADDRFDLFWNLYPKKDGKKKARTAFLNLTKKQQQEAVIDIKAGRYMGRAKQYVPLATTYIHGERWNDEPDQNSDVAAADDYMRGAL